MSAAAVVEQEVSVPARGAAIAWLNAFLATSKDEDRPTLFRTLSLEFFEAGLQLIGCDGAVLFRTWIPKSDTTPGDDAETWPAEDEAPVRSVVVMDPDGFGVGYMRTLLRVTGDESHAFELLTLTTSPVDEEATPALGAEFQTERLTLRACGQRIDLRLFEGTYPDWRQLRLGVDEVERVEGMKIATRLFALIGKLKHVVAAELEFYGEARHIGFVARGESECRGLLAPMMRPPKTDRPTVSRGAE